MKIYAKSALNTEQLNCKINIGCDGIELQLLTELVNTGLGDYHLAKDVFDLDKFGNYPVSIVHTPLLSHYGMANVNIESFCDEDFKLLDQVFYIANWFGKNQGRRVLVVIHSETDRTNMMLISDTWKTVLNAVGCLLFKYPYTELGIENVTPLRNVASGDIHLCSNFHYDNIEMVAELRKELDTDRIGTVLDTCHAMITKKYMTAIFKEFEELPCEDYSMDTYFAKNKDYIKLIHLASMKGSGYGKGRHGVKFNDENIDELKEIMGYYKKYNYTCPITLEVEETDFLVSDGYRDSREALLKVLEL